MLTETKGWLNPQSATSRSTNTNDAQCNFTDVVGGDTFTAASSAARLRTSTNGLNNYDCGYNSSTSGGGWTTSAVPTNWPTGTTEMWLFMLAQVTNDESSNNCLINYGRDSGGTNGTGRGIGVTGSPDFYADAGVTMQSNNSDISSTVSVNSAIRLVEAKFKSGTGNGELWVDATLIGSGMTLATLGTARARIFQFSPPDGRVNGKFGDVIVTTALTTAQRQLIEGYMAWHYNYPACLPSDHPWKNRPPVI